jgi:hypothetical protein
VAYDPADVPPAAPPAPVLGNCQSARCRERERARAREREKEREGEREKAICARV